MKFWWLNHLLRIYGLGFGWVRRTEFDAAASAVAITAGAQAKAGTEGASAGASAGPATGTQAKTNYRNGTAVFVHTIGGLMYEAAIGGQKFSFKAK